MKLSAAMKEWWEEREPKVRHAFRYHPNAEQIIKKMSTLDLTEWEIDKAFDEAEAYLHEGNQTAHRNLG